MYVSFRCALQEFCAYAYALLQEDSNLLRTAPRHGKARPSMPIVMDHDGARTRLYDQFEPYPVPTWPQTNSPALNGDVREAGF
jgi:hypothetical protein